MAVRGNSSDDFIFFSGVVSDACVPFWSAPGFAIPLVRSSIGANTPYIQRVDRDRKVIGYDILHGRIRSVAINSICTTKIGDPEVFALIAPDATAHAGPRSELSPIVRRWVEKIESPLLRMSFARFCGDQNIAYRSAAEAVNAKTVEFGSKEQAARWFMDSVVILDLLKVIEDTPVAALNFRGEEDVVGETPRIEFTKDAKISIKVQKGKLNNINSDSGRKEEVLSIANFVKAATGYNVDIKEAIEARTAHFTIGGPPTRNAEGLIEGIKRRSRQEERLAMVLKSFIEDGPTGQLVLETYSDRATFARNAISYVQNLNISGSTKEIELQIARAIPTIVKMAYPMQKGQILLDLASILGGHTYIGQVIRSLTTRSRASNVLILKEWIISKLGS